MSYLAFCFFYKWFFGCRIYNILNYNFMRFYVLIRGIWHCFCVVLSINIYLIIGTHVSLDIYAQKYQTTILWTTFFLKILRGPKNPRRSPTIITSKSLRPNLLDFFLAGLPMFISLNSLTCISSSFYIVPNLQS